GVVVCGGVLLVSGPVAAPSAASAALFALSMLSVLPLKFLVVYLSALACFYTQNYLGVMWARMAIVGIFSGALVPLVFLPGWLASLAHVLPFASMASTRGLFLRGHAAGAQALRLIGLRAVWVTVLWFGARLIWSRAVRRVTIHGG